MTLLQDKSEPHGFGTVRQARHATAVLLSLIAGCGLQPPSPPAPSVSEFPQFEQCAVSLTLSEGELAHLNTLDTIVVRETSSITAIVMSPFGTKLDMLTLSDYGRTSSQSGTIRPPAAFFSAFKLLLQGSPPLSVSHPPFTLTLEKPCTPLTVPAP